MTDVMARNMVIGAALLLASCADSSADRNGDGKVDAAERAAEMNADAFIPMKAGLWETRFEFSDIELPSLGKAQKRQIMEEVAENASNRRCLSEEEAKQPGADFFGGDGAEKCVYRQFDAKGSNVTMALTCAMEGMGSVDMELAGQMGETSFNYDSKLAIRLPMIGRVNMTGTAIGKYVGACPQG